MQEDCHGHEGTLAGGLGQVFNNRLVFRGTSFNFYLIERGHRAQHPFFFRGVLLNMAGCSAFRWVEIESS